MGKDSLEIISVRKNKESSQKQEMFDKGTP